MQVQVHSLSTTRSLSTECCAGRAGRYPSPVTCVRGVQYGVLGVTAMAWVLQSAQSRSACHACAGTVATRPSDCTTARPVVCSQLVTLVITGRPRRKTPAATPARESAVAQRLGGTSPGTACSATHRWRRSQRPVAHLQPERRPAARRNRTDNHDVVSVGSLLSRQIVPSPPERGLGEGLPLVRRRDPRRSGFTSSKVQSSPSPVERLGESLRSRPAKSIRSGTEIRWSSPLASESPVCPPREQINATPQKL